MHYAKFARALSTALVVSISALGLMAPSASAGETGGDFFYNNNPLAGGLNVSFDGKLVNAAESSLLVPALNIGVECTSIDVQSGVLLPLSEGVSVGHGKMLFLGCLVFEHKTLTHFKLCKVFDDEGEENEGEITAEALFKVVETSGGVAYVLASPSSGGAFADMEFGELCPALANEFIEVTGSLLLQVEGQVASEALAVASGLFGDGLIFGAKSAATLDGKMEALPIGTIGIAS